MNDDFPESRVQPLPPDSQDPAGHAVPTPLITEPKRPRRSSIVAGVILGLVIVVAIASVAIYRSFVGDPFASTRAIPSGAHVVVTFDLLQVRDTTTIQALVDAFAVPLAETGEIEAGLDIVEEIDTAWQDEMGMTFTEDVVPWLGRSASIAVWPDGSSLLVTEDVQMLISVAVRDSEKAGAFIDEILATVADREGGTLETGTLDGRPSWSLLPEDEWAEPVFIILDDDLLLLAPEERTLRASLTASETGGLRSNDEFRSAMDRLPSDRAVAFYMSADVLRDTYSDPVFDELGTTDAALDMLDGWEAMAASMTFADNGLRFDMVQTLESGAGVADAWVGMTEGELLFRDNLPAETYGFFAYPIPDDFIADQLTAWEELDPIVFDEFRSMGFDILGVDVLEDVLPNLGREVLFAALESTDGVMAQEAGFPIGFGLAVGVIDPSPVREAVARLENLAVSEGVPLFVEDGIGMLAEGGETVFAYTVTDDGLVLASNVDTLTGMAEGSSGMTDAALYRELDSTLPGDGLLFYVDTHRIYDHIEWERGWRSVADPVRGLGASLSGSDDGVTGSYLILIDY